MQQICVNPPSVKVRLKTLLEVSAERVALLVAGSGKEEQVDIIIISGIITIFITVLIDHHPHHYHTIREKVVSS